MVSLNDLKKSASSMTDEELKAHLAEIETQRFAARRVPRKAPDPTKSNKSLIQSISKLSAEERDELIRQLKGDS